MGVEIERKFLVVGDGWQSCVESKATLRQAYLAVTETASVRIRIESDSWGWLTIKNAGAGLRRSEYEYPVPVHEAEELLALRTGRAIEKVRHIVRQGCLKWEIDVFSGDLAGLVIAEVELESEDQEITKPDWVGTEVTGDSRYTNARLAEDGLP